LADFNFAVKRITALAFKDSQILMDQIKKIKKDHESKPKTEQSQVESEETKQQ
jgi:hypothetical protein